MNELIIIGICSILTLFASPRHNQCWALEYLWLRLGIVQTSLTLRSPCTKITPFGHQYVDKLSDRIASAFGLHRLSTFDFGLATLFGFAE